MPIPPVVKTWIDSNLSQPQQEGSGLKAQVDDDWDKARRQQYQAVLAENEHPRCKQMGYHFDSVSEAALVKVIEEITP